MNGANALGQESFHHFAVHALRGLQGQILELNKVVAETNTSYRSMLSQAASQSYGVVDARRELSDLKTR